METPHVIHGAPGGAALPAGLEAAKYFPLNALAVADKMSLRQI